MTRVYEALILLICLLVVNEAYSQNNNQVIRGTVIDKQSLGTLPGANVVVIGSDPVKSSSSDSDGSFNISGVTPGRYDLQVTYLGYKSVLIPSIVVTSGKEVVLDIGLEESVSSLKEVVVSGVKKQGTINQMAPVSARSFSMEEVNRYAGGRSDPSRLIKPMALQILIENAIKHNEASSEQPLSISIISEDEKLVVGNNLRLQPHHEPGSKTGPENIRARYKFFTGEPVEVVQDTHSFIVRIPLLSAR